MPAEIPRVSLMVTEGPIEGLRVLLPVKGPAIIGRNPSCEIVVDHPLVSRRHCMVTSTARADGVEVVDLMSNNGVRVDGNKIKEPVTIRVGNRFKVGPAEFEVQPWKTPPAGAPIEEQQDAVLELLGLGIGENDPPDDSALQTSTSAPEEWDETVAAGGEKPSRRQEMQRDLFTDTNPLKVAAAVRDFAVMNGFEGDILFDIGIATAAIVENAIKYGGGGDLIARCDGTAVQVEVRDRGPGLSADVVE
ncbi:MAG: FHA domain-containing protein, partial [Planctomycetota bacterium]